MAVFVESIAPVPGQSLRLLSWTQDVENVRLHTDCGGFQAVRGRGTQWHRHPEIELTLIREGQGLHLVGDRLSRFSDGEAVLIGRNLPHYWRMQRPSTGYCIQFDPQTLNTVWQSPEIDELRFLWGHCERGLRLGGRLAESQHTTVQMLPDLSPLSRLRCLIEILESISTAAEDNVTPLASADFHLPEPGDPYDDSIAMVVNLITTRYQEELRLDEILAHLPLSRATFARHFKLSTGKTFSSFLTEVRIDHVCQALATTKRNVTDIAYESGFNDLPHFNRTFRRLMMQTPRSWRKPHAMHHQP